MTNTKQVLNKTSQLEYDYVIIGSGFGGSVSALRLSEKGYKVLVIEKGKWWKAEDFPKTNWSLRKWLWEPKLGMKGFFKLTFLKHITVVSGVGVGGGSLTYANTLPIPKKKFFTTGTWAKLANWEEELSEHYQTAYKMLGADKNPSTADADKAILQLAKNLDREEHFDQTKVGIYFGSPGKTVPDPYFDGKGPERTGCIHCGECMTGCRHGAKNTLDKNYLYLAQQLGAEIIAEHEVSNVIPIDNQHGNSGYTISYKSGKGSPKTTNANGVIFSGGVLGTVPLLLDLKESSLPYLSDRLGMTVSTNNEALINVVSRSKEKDYSKGIAIGSILHTDEDTHLEPCRYGEGSNFFRIMYVPMAFGKNAFTRFGKMLLEYFKSPIDHARTFVSRSYSKRTTILLFMQTLNSTIKIKKGGLLYGFNTEMDEGIAPSAFIPEAKELAQEYAKIVDGKIYVGFTETLFGVPSTAHILGGATMGDNTSNGVIDANNKVFGYENMYVCDGSMISANPGVNPSLSITAISERAMSKIPPKTITQSLDPNSNKEKKPQENHMDNLEKSKEEELEKKHASKQVEKQAGKLEGHIDGKPDYYFENGLLVMTEKYLLKRGYCCGNKCRHCPYDYENVPNG